MLRIPLADLDLPQTRQELAGALQEGLIMAYPTDTVYGLGGRADLDSVCRAIDRLKARPAGQVYSVALASLAMLPRLVVCTDERERQLMDAILPGPYTLLVRLQDSYRLPANQFQAVLGVRIPRLPSLLGLIQETGTPLITTSVNCSGQPPLNRAEDIIEQFPEIDCLIDAGELPVQPPSTLLDISAGQPYLIRRRGAGLEEVLAVLNRLGLAWDFMPRTAP